MDDQSSYLTIGKFDPNAYGWRELSLIKELREVSVKSNEVYLSLLNIIHVSDTHLCDAQSPTRVEFLDRYADPHHPQSKILGMLVGTYRAHEFLTTQVMESMIQAINGIERGPITRSRIDTVLITGDLIDNAQRNELNWFQSLVLGKKLTPDSGSLVKWEGVGGDFYSPYYWNPHGTPPNELDDYPRSLYGFPLLPEILDAARAPFFPSGLRHNWLAVHGNHDSLLQGTVTPNLALRVESKSDEKVFEIDQKLALEALVDVSDIGPASYPAYSNLSKRKVSADADRDFLNDGDWLNYFKSPVDALFDKDQSFNKSNKYWRKDYEFISIISLDTVNYHGGWQGSLDQEQFTWLKSQVQSLQDRYIVITSHHPLQDLYNGYTTDSNDPKVLREEIEEFLVSQANVILWICGHTHRHKIKYFGENEESGFWQIESSSLIDWPQQGRIIEIFLDKEESIWIVSTPVNHSGSLLASCQDADLSQVNDLAGVSRVLSVNDWQRRSGEFSIEKNEGTIFDRNGAISIKKRLSLLK